MTVTLELWHVVAITTAAFWWPAWRIPTGQAYNPFNSIVAIGLFAVPIVWWGGFFLGRLTA